MDSPPLRKERYERSMKMDKRFRVGIVGAGAISGRYIETIQRKFQQMEIVSVCAAHPESAGRKAQEYGLTACSFQEMLADPSIDMVLNLTPVGAHYEIIKAALLAGKHVYTEKTMTDDPRTARELMALAKEKGLYLGCAPDTFLGDSVQADQAFFAIYGTKGILYLTDPNQFGGDVMLLRETDDFRKPPRPEKLEPVNPYLEESRGLGRYTIISNNATKGAYVCKNI